MPPMGYEHTTPIHVLAMDHTRHQVPLCNHDRGIFISIFSMFLNVFKTILAGLFQINFNDMLCVCRKNYGTENVLIKLKDV